MTVPTFRSVSHTGQVVPPPTDLAEQYCRTVALANGLADTTIVTTVREIDALRTELATAVDELHDMRLSRDAWAERAQVAERELSRLQDQSVRIEELKAECAEWAQGFATAVAERDAARSERDTWRAGVSAVAR